MKTFSGVAATFFAIGLSVLLESHGILLQEILGLAICYLAGVVIGGVIETAAEGSDKP